MSYVDISVAQMQDFMEALSFRELSIEERSSKYPSGAIRVVKERVFTRPLGEGEIRVYSSVTGQTSRAKGRDAIRVQYWVDGVKVAGTTRVHRVENWRRNLLNRVYELENLVKSGYLNRVPRDSTGTPMVVRKAKRTGKKFWGSSLFPKNNETRRLDAESSEENFACTDYIINEIKRIWYSPAQEDIKHWAEHNMAGGGLTAYEEGLDLPDGSELGEDTTKDEYFQRMFDIWLERFEKGTWMYSDDDHGIMMQAWRVLYVPVGTPVNVDSLGNWENRKQDLYGVYEDKITSWLWQSEFYAGALFGHEGIDHMKGEEGKDFDRIVLTAWIPWEAVDWASTIAYNISFFWQENELCVKDKEPVYELGVSRNYLDDDNHDGDWTIDKAMNAEFMEIPELMHCPWCGAEDIGYEGSLEDGTQEVRCNSCGGTWFEIWKFVGYELVSGEFASESVEVWSATPYPYL